MKLNKADLTDGNVFQWAVGFRPPYWDDDTIYYSAEAMRTVWPVVEQANEHANFNGATLFYAEDWQKLRSLLDSTVGLDAGLVQELKEFGELAFQKDDCVTVYGY